MRKILTVTLILVAVFLFSAPSVLAQGEPCTADFNCDQNVDANDVSTFLSQFGRSPFNDPCPDCYDSPCPCSSTVPQTGQRTSYATGDDGDLEKGLIWPNPRFTDNLDGTIADNLTNLIWLRSANCFGLRTWEQALHDCNTFFADGTCGLTDGSQAGDWRLPSRFELESLLDMAYYAPALSNTAGTGQWSQGDPFINVQSDFYWSSTSSVGFFNGAWYLGLWYGYVASGDKASSSYVWPVRGGQ